MNIDGGLDPRVVRTASSFRHDPADILRRVLDVACLAADAVLRVDLEPGLSAVAGGPRDRVRLYGIDAPEGARNPWVMEPIKASIDIGRSTAARFRRDGRGARAVQARLAALGGG